MKKKIKLKALKLKSKVVNRSKKKRDYTWVG